MLCAAQSSVHRDDLAEAVVRLVDRRHDLPSELPLLIGEPDAPGYAEIQDIVGAALHGEGWKTTRIPQPPATAGIVLQHEALGDAACILPLPPPAVLSLVVGHDPFQALAHAL